MFKSLKLVGHSTSVLFWPTNKRGYGLLLIDVKHQYYFGCFSLDGVSYDGTLPLNIKKSFASFFGKKYVTLFYENDHSIDKHLSRFFGSEYQKDFVNNYTNTIRAKSLIDYSNNAISSLGHILSIDNKTIVDLNKRNRFFR